jgi:hypothetical protein
VLARDIVDPACYVPERWVISKVDQKGRIGKDDSQARFARHRIMM